MNNQKLVDIARLFLKESNSKDIKGSYKAKKVLTSILDLDPSELEYLLFAWSATYDGAMEWDNEDFDILGKHLGVAAKAWKNRYEW